MILARGAHHNQPTSATIKTNSDPFSATWGATTRWKPGVPKDRRSKSRSRLLDVQHTQGKLIAATIASPLPAPPLRLDKPLPPLPAEAFEYESHISDVDGTQILPESYPELQHTISRADSKRSNNLSESSKSSNGLWGKRKSIFSIGWSKSKAQKVQHASKNQVMRERVENNPNERKEQDEKPATKPAANEELEKPRMVDHGTQTTPSLERRYLESLASETSISTLSLSSSSDSQPTLKNSENESDMSPPTISFKTPIWSPGISKNGPGPYEYFDIALETNEDMASEREDELSLPTTSTVKRHHHESHGSLPPRRRSETETTASSVDSYASEYSVRDVEATWDARRPSIMGSALFETVHHSSSENLASQMHARNESANTVILHSSDKSEKDTRKTTLNQAEENQQSAAAAMESPPPSTSMSLVAKQPTTRGRTHFRPAPTMFQRRSSHSPFHGKPAAGRNSSESSPISPLRQEIKLSDSPPKDKAVRQPSFGFFRRPIYGNDMVGSGDPDVPDHFVGSILCPMHPKHRSGGMGTCPYHGRRISIITDDSDERVERAASHQEDMNFWAQMEAGGYDWANKRTNDEEEEQKPQIKLNVEDHAADSILCPANPRYQGPAGKGVCVLHGRGKRTFFDSDDSVPRVRDF